MVVSYCSIANKTATSGRLFHSSGVRFLIEIQIYRIGGAQCLKDCQPSSASKFFSIRSSSPIIAVSPFMVVSLFTLIAGVSLVILGGICRKRTQAFGLLLLGFILITYAVLSIILETEGANGTRRETESSIQGVRAGDAQCLKGCQRLIWME